VKIAAGWMIEKAGWKGRSVGKSAIHDKQALVIINKGGASGKEIFELSELVTKDVLLKFNIELEREVQVIGDNCGEKRKGLTRPNFFFTDFVVNIAIT